MSPKVSCEENCEGAKQPSGGKVWEGVPSQGRGKFCIWSPEKKKKQQQQQQFRMHIIYLGKDY